MVTDTTEITARVLVHLNSWPEKPARFTIDELQNSSPAIMLQPLPSSRIVKKYVDGSFLGVFSFAVYLRISAADTYDKINAYDTLRSLAEWLEATELPDIGNGRVATSLEQTATPALAEQDDDTEDYQTIFALNYKQSAHEPKA